MAMKSSEPPTADEIFAKAKIGLEPIVAYLGDKQFLASADVSLADFLVWEGIETILQITQDRRVFTDFPTLEAYHARISDLPTFAAFRASDNFFALPFGPSAMLGRVE